MPKAKYDEMQEQKRNQIGSQAFEMLVMLLLLDTIVYYLGFRWIEYSTSVFMILLVCCGVHTIRMILLGVMRAPNTSGVSLWAVIVGVVAIGAAGTLLIAKFVVSGNAVSSNDNGGWLLMAASGGLLLASGVVYLIKRVRDSRHDD